MIRYPGTQLFVDQSIDVGVHHLDAAIKSADGPVVVAGLSEGSMVIDREQARLLNDPNAPPPDQVTFVIFGDPGPAFCRCCRTVRTFRWWASPR